MGADIADDETSDDETSDDETSDDETSSPLMSEVATPTQYRRACLQWCVLVVIGLGAIAGFNVVINPRAVFPTTWFPPLVWTARAYHVRTLRARPRDNLKTLIVGSSRTMKLEPALVATHTGGEVYNASMNVGLAEDYYAMTRFVVDELNTPIRTLIVGLDVLALHPSLHPDERLLSTPELSRHLPLMWRLRALWRQLTSALAWSVLDSSISSLKYSWTQYPEPASSFGEDGLLTYNDWDPQLQRGTFSMDAPMAASKVVYRKLYKDFDTIGAERLAHINQLIDLCAERTITLYIFITPLHPSLRAHLLEHGAPLDRLRRQVLQSLRDHEHADTLRVFDAHAIERFGGSPEYFYDGIHLRVENTRLIWTRLLQRTPGDF